MLPPQTSKQQNHFNDNKVITPAAGESVFSNLLKMSAMWMPDLVLLRDKTQQMSQQRRPILSPRMNNTKPGRGDLSGVVKMLIDCVRCFLLFECGA